MATQRNGDVVTGDGDDHDDDDDSNAPFFAMKFGLGRLSVSLSQAEVVCVSVCVLGKHFASTETPQATWSSSPSFLSPMSIGLVRAFVAMRSQFHDNFFFCLFK